jgi:hypothetical protein
MDMSPISEEYEKELRQPIQNIVSGRMIRAVLIQLQFVKKELLVAMQAIDELFNANQVNLQLLAVTPAILLIFLLQVSSRMIISGIKSSSRGKFIESSSAIYRELRSGIRELERMFLFSLSTANGGGAQALAVRSIPDINPRSPGSSPSSSTQQPVAMDTISEATVLESMISSNRSDLDIFSYGKMMSILHRLHSILVLNSSQFTHDSLRMLQEDLRDLIATSLSLPQRILLLERIVRSYPFLQNHRTKSAWSGGLLP